MFPSQITEDCFLQRSVGVGRFGRGRLTAEGPTPRQFSLPRLFTWKEQKHQQQITDDTGSCFHVMSPLKLLLLSTC